MAMRAFCSTLLMPVVGMWLASGGIAAAADAYPSKPVRIITGSAGTTPDILARLLGQRLAERWGQPLVVENRGGAGATIAADIAAKAPPDGYSLLMAQLASHASAPTLVKNLPYDPVRDFAPISKVAATPLMLISHPSFPAANLAGLLDYAKSHPGALTIATAGIGTPGHLATELLRNVTALDVLRVPYKGGVASLQAVMSGEAKASFNALPTALPQVRTGKVRAYAVTGRKRFGGAPDIPTADEAGLPGFESTAWYGMMAPAHLPNELLDRLNRDIVSVLRSSSFQAPMLARGVETTPSTPAEFATFIQSEIVKWRKVLESSGAMKD